MGSSLQANNGKNKSPTTLATLERHNGIFTRTWRNSTELLLEELILLGVEMEETEENKKLRTEVNQIFKEIDDREDDEPIMFENYEIEQAIKALKNKKSSGPDNIRSEIFFKKRKIFGHLILRDFSKCAQQGKFSVRWKEAT